MTKPMPDASKAISAFVNVLAAVCERHKIDQAFLHVYGPEMDRMLRLEETLSESDRQLLKSLYKAFRRALEWHGPRLH